jgi:hypothetical protein
VEHLLEGLGFLFSIFNSSVQKNPRVSAANQTLFGIPGFALVKSANGQLEYI